MAERTYGDWLDEQRRFGRSGSSDYGRMGMMGREEEGGRDRGRGAMEREDYGRGSYAGRDYGREDYGRMGLGSYGRGDFERGDYGRGYGAYGTERDYGRERDLGRGGYGAYGSERFGREYGDTYAREDDYGVSRARGYGPYGMLRGEGMGREEYGRGWSAERSGWGTERDEGRRHEGGGMFERMGERMREGARRLTGKAPKGYTRSDERIREDVYDRLLRSGRNAEDVEVEVKNGDVTLRGRVDSREDRRALEDEVEDVLGVKDVNNSLRVSRAGEETRSETYVASPSGTGATTTGSKSTLHS